jgi:hypothetical protein
MTRLVALFFAGIAVLLAAYWVVPGAKPPEMAAVGPAMKAATAPILPQALVRSEPQAPVAAAAPALAATAQPPVATSAETAAQRPVKTAEGGCDTDPIKCMLEGRGHRPDPTETTGSIVPRKALAKPATKLPPQPLARSQP